MHPLLITGARPNYMKVAPLVRAFRRVGIEPTLVNTGQHFDDAMSTVFVRDLGLPAPDVDLRIGPDTPVRQTARIMTELEPVLATVRPDAVVVVGDVNSTLAAALAANLAGVPVAHVEAGLRSFDESMPEERNRVLTDRLSSWLLTPSADADENLRREGIDPARIHRVGNVMIDTLDWVHARLPVDAIVTERGLTARGYALATFHRPSNVDARPRLEAIVTALAALGAHMPVVFPVHPRTRRAMQTFDLTMPPGIAATGPLPYPEFTALLSQAALVLSDSGGIQEEATVLGTPCLTVRTTTERPVTLECGCNELVEADPDAIAGAVERVLRAPSLSSSRPPLWDGRAAERVVAALTSSSPQSLRVKLNLAA